MISLILPYWDRQEAANEALALLDKTYQGMDLELVIVNDGGDFVLPKLSLKTTVVDLPKKSEPKCPCTAWNAGVEAASGFYVVLSCIEILHERPVLQSMASELDSLGPMGYVLAAAWCPEGGWHCHSSVPVPTCPSGTGIAFCGMLRKALFQKVGGFDEEYREGAGYEDRDLINRLFAFGAKFVIRDDLIVTHPKKGATIYWGADKFARNEALYFKKWPNSIVRICCVNYGNYLGRGSEYVNNLYRMVARNATAFRFTCFTDDDSGLDEGIEAKRLPVSLMGWDNKIALFHPETFAKGERVVYFDLDTLILSPIDNLLSYRGRFAVLRDFWRPEGLGPAVMMWESGTHDWIWTEYEQRGRPDLVRGDQEWLEEVLKDRDILQAVFPDFFVSYKTHCNPYPPEKAGVVCFHGLPRPHECTQKWVQDTWSGEASRLNLHIAVNTDVKKILSNVWENRDAAPWICSSPKHEGEALIVGSGPSLLKTLEAVRAYKDGGGVIFALNNSASVLNEAGIIPDYQVILDARPENIKFLTNCGIYLLASQVDPSLFKQVSGHALQWHPVIEGLGELFPDAPITLIGGGTTVGLSSMALAYAMGFRKLHLFGYDSSFTEVTHAIPQDRTEQEAASFEVSVGEKTFKTNAAMAKQAELFPQFAQTLADLDVVIKVYGEGLLPHIAHTLTT
jgi:hypothetical protein